MQQQLSSGTKNKPMQGLVTVELFDAKTYEKIKEIKSKNIITKHGYRHIQSKIIQAILAGGSVSTPNLANDFWQIMLWSTTNPEIDESFPLLGNLVGWSNIQTYSGSDTLRGTINIAETSIITDAEGIYTRLHLVFDWPTHAANGTFQTIIFSPVTDPVAALKLFSISNIVGPDIYPYDLEWDGSNLWVAGDNTGKVYKINPDTGAVITTFNNQGGAPRGVTWDGTNLWTAEIINAGIYKINPDTGEVISSIVPPTTYPTGLAWDGTNLWVVAVDTNRIYQLNPTTGDVISYFAIPSNSAGLTWDGSNLWLSNMSTKLIYIIDPNTGTTFNSYANISGGLTLAGNILFAANIGSNVIYKILRTMYSTRTLLPTPISKSSANTMKVHYDFVF